MKFRTNRIAPLALATVLAFGAAACEGEDTVNDEIQDVEDGAEDAAEDTADAADEAEQELDQEMTDEDEAGDADEAEGVESDDPTTEE